MKRFFLVLLALVCVVGVGSASVFFARRSMQASAAPTDESWQTGSSAPRDVAPSPIPYADVAAYDEPAAGNPFATQSYEPQRVAANEMDDRVPASQTNTARWGQSAEIPDAAMDDDIPVTNPRRRPAQVAAVSNDEEMPVSRASEPFVGRERRAATTRYPEQAAAAEFPIESEPTDFDAQVQQSRQQNGQNLAETDRYGRPLERVPTMQIGNDAEDQWPSQPEVRSPRKSDPPALDSWPSAGPGRIDSDEGTGRPGDPKLSGSQAPTLTIEKVAPAEIQIGKPAKFTIKVRNVGTAAAQGVEIHDSIPLGTQLIEARPQATRGPQGTLLWEMGALQPGEETSIELQLMPQAEGEIGSVATVHFRAEASVRTIATKPMLTMEVRGPAKVMKGENVSLRIRLSNPGTGAATGIMLSEEVPAGLAHPSGPELEFEVGTLRPGESRELELGLKATEAGQVANVLVAQSEANLRVEATTDIEVVAPQLAVTLAGPKRRYLERNATHNISVSNPGTAAARDIELVAVLPKELKFVEANNGGQFDPVTNSVYWSLEELPPQETGTVQLTTLPLRTGDARLLIKSSAQAGLTDQREEILAIEGMAALNFQLSDVHDPIEVGGQTSYEIRVTNQGSKAATNIRLAALLPRELKPVSAEGPVRYRVEGQRVIFEPLKQLAPKADTVYTLKVQAVDAGDLRVQVQIATDEIREPITKEESTRVFGDE